RSSDLLLFDDLEALQLERGQLPEAFATAELGRQWALDDFEGQREPRAAPAGTNPPTLPVLQSKLEPGTVLLYLSLAEESILWRVTADSWQLVRFPAMRTEIAA